METTIVIPNLRYCSCWIGAGHGGALLLVNPAGNFLTMYHIRNFSPQRLLLLRMTHLRDTQAMNCFLLFDFPSSLFFSCLILSGKCRRVAQGGPERFWSTRGSYGPCGPRGPTRSALIHTFSNFIKIVDHSGSGWTRTTRETMNPLADQ